MNDDQVLAYLQDAENFKRLYEKLSEIGCYSCGDVGTTTESCWCGYETGVYECVGEDE